MEGGVFAVALCVSVFANVISVIFGVFVNVFGENIPFLGQNNPGGRHLELYCGQSAR